VGYLAASLAATVLCFLILLLGSFLLGADPNPHKQGIGDLILATVLLGVAFLWPVVSICAAVPMFAFINYGESTGKGALFYVLAGLAIGLLPAIVSMIAKLAADSRIDLAVFFIVGSVAISGACGGLVYWFVAGRGGRLSCYVARCAVVAAGLFSLRSYWFLA
jgi:hypothetical protein